MQLQFSDDKKGAPSAGSTDNYVINSVDGQVQCVLFCQLQWASELLLYGTDSSIVVVKLTLPEDDDKSSACFRHETLYTFSQPAGVRCLAWCGETSLAGVSQCVKFVAAGGLTGCGDVGDHTLFIHCRSTKADADGVQVSRLRGHTDFINSLAMSCDDVTLASVADDCTCRVWNTRQATDCATIRLDAPGVGVCWHGTESNQLLVATSSGRITVYTCSPPAHPSPADHSAPRSNSWQVIAVQAVHVWPGSTEVLDADWHAHSGVVALLSHSCVATLSLDLPGEVNTVHTITSGLSRMARFSNTAKPLLASCTLTQVKVTDLSTPAAAQVTDIQSVSGISWHAIGRYLAASSGDKITLWRVSCT